MLRFLFLLAVAMLPACQGLAKYDSIPAVEDAGHLDSQRDAPTKDAGHERVALTDVGGSDGCRTTEAACSATCGVVEGPFCLSDAGRPPRSPVWCGACSDCPEIAKALSEESALVKICGADDTCVRSNVLICGISHREGADLTTLTAIAQRYYQRCRNPNLTPKCATIMYKCVQGICT